MAPRKAETQPDPDLHASRGSVRSSEHLEWQAADSTHPISRQTLLLLRRSESCSSASRRTNVSSGGRRRAQSAYARAGQQNKTHLLARRRSRSRRSRGATLKVSGS